MKIKKLTDNKIQVILNLSEFEQNNINSFIESLFNEQKFFLDVLLRAEKEVNFSTDGYKLFIDAYFDVNNFLIFTITKYSSINNDVGLDNLSSFKNPKRLTIKRKIFNFFSKNLIYCFNNFDIYSDFCKIISNYSNFNIDNFSNNISLYEYNSKYYLIVKNIKYNITNFNIFTSNISEFAKYIKHTNVFEAKLLEHGKMLITKNGLIGFN